MTEKFKVATLGRVALRCEPSVRFEACRAVEAKVSFRGLFLLGWGCCVAAESGLRKKRDFHANFSFQSVLRDIISPTA